MTEFRTIDQVADYFGVHPKTVRGWIDSGKLEAFRVGRLFRIREEALQEFMQGPFTHEQGIRHGDEDRDLAHDDGMADKAARIMELAEELRQELIAS